jgi:hypothetical protein
MRDAFPVATTGWLGACILEGDSRAGSGDCRVIDISVIGVGLELFGAVTEYLIWRRTVVHVSVSVGSSVSPSSGCGSQGHDSETTRQVRVGLEFVDLSETERAIIDVIEKLGAAW